MIGARLSKFTLISGGGWLLDLGVMLGLVAMGASSFGANCAGAVCGVSFVFLMAQRRVFTETHGGRINWRLLLPYLLWQTLAILLASGLVHFLAQLMTGGATALIARLGLGLSAAVAAAGAAKILVTPVTLYANFLVFGWLAERRISWS